MKQQNTIHLDVFFLLSVKLFPFCFVLSVSFLPLLMFVLSFLRSKDLSGELRHNTEVRLVGL